MTEVTTSLSIGQVAERTGLSVHALRFYEREGLFANPVRRGSSGRRVYGDDDVEWLTICVILRASGMPLPAIRRYAELVSQGAGNEEERLNLLREHQNRVNVQIGQLTQCLDLITFKVGVYEDIVNDGDPAACLTGRQQVGLGEPEGDVAGVVAMFAGLDVEQEMRVDSRVS